MIFFFKTTVYFHQDPPAPVVRGIRRNDAGPLRFDRIRGLVHSVVFESRLRAKYLLRLGSVLHARQLDDDAIGALLLDQRFGHAELIDTITQRGQVARNDLLGLFLQRASRTYDQREAVAPAAIGQLGGGGARASGLIHFRSRAGLRAIGFGVQHDGNASPLLSNRCESSRAQSGTNVVDVTLLHFRERRFDRLPSGSARLQSRPNGMRLAPIARSQPGTVEAGSARRCIDRRDPPQRIRRGELHFSVRKTRQERSPLSFDILELDLFRLQHAQHFFLQRRIHGGAAVCGNLHRGLLREHDRQGVDEAEQDHAATSMYFHFEIGPFLTAHRARRGK